MSLSNPSAFSIIKKQFQYKKEAYMDNFFSLILLQVFAIVFSSGGIGSTGTGSQSIFIQITYYSADGVIFFTMIWGLITGIYLTTKNYRYDDFSFVTNRMTSNVSNSLFLIAASIFAGATAMLTTFLQKFLLLIFGKVEYFINYELTDYYLQFLLGIGASILHILFLCAIGYFIGTLVQVHKLFAFIIPASFITMLISSDYETMNIGRKLFQFYYEEASFLLFSVKILISVIGLFVASFLISNRLEVKR